MCGTMRPCVTRVYQSCVIDITTVTAPRHTSRGSRRRGRCVAPRVPPSHVPLRRHRSHGGILYMPLSVGGEESAKPGKKSHLLSGAPLAGLCALSEVATGLCAPVRRAPGSPRHRESPTSARPFVMPLLHARGPDASVTTNRTADTGFGLRMGMPDSRLGAKRTAYRYSSAGPVLDVCSMRVAGMAPMA